MLASATLLWVSAQDKGGFAHRISVLFGLATSTCYLTAGFQTVNHGLPPRKGDNVKWGRLSR